MAYNYPNLENIIPLFGALPNVLSASHPNNFLNQLAAAITTATVGGVSASPAATTSITSITAHTKRERTPEPPPAPKLSLNSSASNIMKPNQGTAPMDVENDSEPETTVTTATATNTTATTALTAKSAEKCTPMHLHDPNLFLNGLMPNASLNSGYMFFPTTAAAAAAAAAAPSANSMLMDHTAMMAAAMQQMHQNYANYGLSTPTTDGVSVDGNAAQSADGYPGGSTSASAPNIKEVIKTKSCMLFPPNPHAPPPTIRERPPGCRTVFVGGLPENITEEIVREIFESCGEITTLRMSKKNFCHIRYRQETSIDRAIYLSGYRVRISTANEPGNFGRLHVDYAQARDDQYDYECKQRQLQREQRHRERLSLDRLRSQSPPPIQHYTEHEASVVAENLRNNDTFVKAIQTITVWLERGDCTKRNANVFYSMIQSTHAHVRRLYTDKQQLEDDLRKARESYRKQMLTMSTQFTQIEKVFNAASHKKVWDHFTKAQRKNIDQWKKLATELRSVQIEDDEMEVSDDDRDYHHRHHNASGNSSSAKRARYDSDLKEENELLRCQLEAIRNEMSLERTDIKYDSDFREKQIKVLQETIRNMQTQLLQTKMREQKDAKIIEQLEQRLKEAGVKQLLLKTRIKETSARLKDKEVSSSVNSETSEMLLDETEPEQETSSDTNKTKTTSVMELKSFGNDKTTLLQDNMQIIDIDVYKSDDDVSIIEEITDVVEIHEIDDEEKIVENIETAKEAEVQQIREKTIVEIATTTTTTTAEIPAKADVTTTGSEISESVVVNETKEQAEQRELIKETKLTEELKAQEVVVKSQHLELTLSEARLVALISTFLLVQPFGVNVANIHSYLVNVLSECEAPAISELNSLLEKYRNLFAQQTIEDGKWSFCGFKTTDEQSEITKTTSINDENAEEK